MATLLAAPGRVSENPKSFTPSVLSEPISNILSLIFRVCASIVVLPVTFRLPPIETSPERVT